MLDPEGRAEVDAIISSLRTEGRGILLVTHDLDDLAHADRVAVMSHGRVVHQGTPAEFPRDADELAEWDLAPTTLGTLARELELLGGCVPRYGTAEEMAAALWP